MDWIKVLKNGLFTENPTFVQLLGMCPTLAITTSVVNGIGMGISATVVLICSNVVISLIRNFIPGKIRIASFIIVIAGFVSLVDMVLKAYTPALSNSLGIFIPLIVVNCIILARAEAFASRNGVVRSALDGLGMGLGFTGALIIISSVRELIGKGTVLGFPVFGAGYSPALMAILPPGGFIILGIILGVINLITARRRASA
ncbi:MAG: Electron transport complex protein RnfE [Firmicutes bacterium ADurb.Bin193]|nr:MAG: Electron transport complex protein RnfE [Firmicutes bacterium ADurb.Bin193]